ncbi:DUF4326 domain-containing protein [uncultured Pseudoalteromonas sp.]|uniref:DUF4326 domain-containing protein n=1 Tax=Pseudoalteromonas sp. DY56-GL22 TaxID=2967126 RepID=UPI00262C5DE4|nr:DUF4326 domain-containing protein [uncultured Pseudoalteromonas sp.]MED5512304.1 DUF4326 domain-containing protein [Pseudomonadota bacterium]
MNLLILYPSLFLSFEKFERKLKNILSENSPQKISYYSDPNGFVEKYVAIHLPDTATVNIPKFDLENITHAIIFDDGEEFVEELASIRLRIVPIRRIKIKITRVINIKKDNKYKGLTSNEKYEYIGRGSYWGNPYSMYENGDDRDEVIRKFKYDFDFEKFPNKDKSEVYKLAGKRLGCFCKPNACHGDVLADFLNSWDDGE